MEVCNFIIGALCASRTSQFHSLAHMTYNIIANSLETLLGEIFHIYTLNQGWGVGAGLFWLLGAGAA